MFYYNKFPEGTNLNEELKKIIHGNLYTREDLSVVNEAFLQYLVLYDLQVQEHNIAIYGLICFCKEAFANSSLTPYQIAVAILEFAPDGFQFTDVVLEFLISYLKVTRDDTATRSDVAHTVGCIVDMIYLASCIAGKEKAA